MKEREGFDNLLIEPVRALAVGTKVSLALPDEIRRRWQKSDARKIAMARTRICLEKRIGNTFLGSFAIGAIMEVLFPELTAQPQTS